MFVPVANVAIRVCLDLTPFHIGCVPVPESKNPHNMSRHPADLLVPTDSKRLYPCFGSFRFSVAEMGPELLPLSFPLLEHPIDEMARETGPTRRSI